MTPIKAENLVELFKLMADGDQITYAVSVYDLAPTIWVLVKVRSQHNCYRRTVELRNLYSVYTQPPPYTSHKDYKFFIVSVPTALAWFIQPDWHTTPTRSTIII